MRARGTNATFDILVGSGIQGSKGVELDDMLKTSEDLSKGNAVNGAF